MKEITPQVFVVGETRLLNGGLYGMLEAIGAPEWYCDGYSCTEVLVEAAGKLCYMSFDTALNDNLTATGTRDNAEYIQQGLIKTKHGSVLEHVTVNLAFTGVSRVLTHELVRHRPGAAYSQTSGRFVRTKELSAWVPSVVRENPELHKLFLEAFHHQEDVLAEMVKVSGIENMTDFAKKKELTSAFRRVIGDGASTNIMATYNHRALRHLISVRTSRHAEEEMRMVFNRVFGQVASRYPAIYADAKNYFFNGYDEISFDNEKV